MRDQTTGGGLTVGTGNDHGALIQSAYNGGEGVRSDPGHHVAGDNRSTTEPEATAQAGRGAPGQQRSRQARAHEYLDRRMQGSAE
jgi:hypothetical protein